MTNCSSQGKEQREGFHNWPYLWRKCDVSLWHLYTAWYTILHSVFLAADLKDLIFPATITTYGPTVVLAQLFVTGLGIKPMLGLKAAPFLVTLFFLTEISSFFQFTVWPYVLLCWHSCWKCTFFGGKTGYGNFYCFCWLATKNRGLYVKPPPPPQQPWEQGQLLKSQQLKREAISEPQGMSDTYS